MHSSYSTKSPYISKETRQTLLFFENNTDIVAVWTFILEPIVDYVSLSKTKLERLKTVFEDTWITDLSVKLDQIIDILS